METSETTWGLREFMHFIAKECRKARLDKTRTSHLFARAVCTDLRDKGHASVERLRSGNSNYFGAEIDGNLVLVSAFASQERWWNTPSDGFMDCVKRAKTKVPACRWGVVLLRVPELSGAWIEGGEFEKLPSWPEKFNESDIRRLKKAKAACEFSDWEALMEFIRRGCVPRSRLIRKPA